GGVTGPLARQRVGERLAGRTILGADDQVNVRDLVALAYEGFADCKRTDGHDRLLAGESGNLSAGVRQGVKPARIPDTGQAHVRHLDSSQNRSPGLLG